MAIRNPKVELARAYGAPDAKGKYCVLVDRLWPRGIKKEDLPYDAWPKELAPSSELRKWFNHDPERFDQFRKRYCKELDDKKSELTSLLEAAQGKPLLLLYGAKDAEHNQAVVLKEYVEKHAAALLSH